MFQPTDRFKICVASARTDRISSRIIFTPNRIEQFLEAPISGSIPEKEDNTNYQKRQQSGIMRQQISNLLISCFNQQTASGPIFTLPN